MKAAAAETLQLTKATTSRNLGGEKTFPAGLVQFIDLPLMNFNLKPDQLQFVQQELEQGRYASPDEVIAAALHLLKQRNRSEQWAQEVGEKIDVAVAQLERGEGKDGETSLAQLKERLHQRKTQPQ